MRAKLLGAVTAAALLGWIGVASAQEPIQLTDAQLDAVTSGMTAFLAIQVVNGALVNPVIALSAADILGGAEPAGTANALVTTGFAPNAADASLFISAGVIGIETPGDEDDVLILREEDVLR